MQPGPSGPAVADPHLLDNPVWHALVTTPVGLAERVGDAVRHHPDVSGFSAVPDRPDPGAWTDLAGLVGPGGRAALVRSAVVAPPGWTVQMVVPGVQMVATGPLGAPDPDAVVLGPELVAEVSELVARTGAGPWRPRAVEGGRHVGLEHEGRLVAVAGLRLQPPGWCEIRVVATDPDGHRLGSADRLVRHLAHLVEASGRVPFVQVPAHDVAAVARHERLGFAGRREVVALVLVPTAG